MNKLNFPKDCNAIAAINTLPKGKYVLHLSTPNSVKEWKWSNGKSGFLFTADSEPTKVDGIVEAGIIVGGAAKTSDGRSILNDKGVDESFTVTNTGKRMEFLPL